MKKIEETKNSILSEQEEEKRKIDSWRPDKITGDDVKRSIYAEHEKRMEAIYAVRQAIKNNQIDSETARKVLAGLEMYKYAVDAECDIKLAKVNAAEQLDSSHYNPTDKEKKVIKAANKTIQESLKISTKFTKRVAKANDIAKNINSWRSRAELLVFWVAERGYSAEDVIANEFGVNKKQGV